MDNFTDLSSYKPLYRFQGADLDEDLVTDYYDPETDVYEDDEYRDEDYGDSYDDEYDPCTKSIYDLNDGNTCNHVDFESMPPLHEVKGVYDQLIYKPCCISNQTSGDAFHGYLHLDHCEVYIFTFASSYFRLFIFYYGLNNLPLL